FRKLPPPTTAVTPRATVASSAGSHKCSSPPGSASRYLNRNTHSAYTRTISVSMPRAKNTSSRPVLRRGLSCLSKKVMAMAKGPRKPGSALPRVEGGRRTSEADLGRLTLGGGDFEQGRLGEAEHVGDNHGREDLALVVEGHNRIVVSLAGKPDLVLGG